MREVNTKLVSLLTNIDTLVDNKVTILSSIETYNTKLKELKKDCCISLLRNAADVWNLEKHKDRTAHITGVQSYPQNDIVWGDAQYVYSELTNIVKYFHY